MVLSASSHFIYTTFSFSHASQFLQFLLSPLLNDLSSLLICICTSCQHILRAYYLVSVRYGVGYGLQEVRHSIAHPHRVAGAPSHHRPCGAILLVIFHHDIHAGHFTRSTFLAINDTISVTMCISTTIHLAPESAVPIQLLLYLYYILHTDQLIFLCVHCSHLSILFLTNCTKFTRFICFYNDDFFLLNLLLQ